MTPQQVRQRYKVIQQFQDKWADAEIDLQSTCKHPAVTKKYQGSSGNYDPSADCYWIEFKCPDCGKRWMEDQ